jgi:hypothetical protein
MPAKRTSRSTRRCRFCGKRFTPKIARQIYCDDPACALKRRKEYMKRYMAKWKARNTNYWKSERQYEYLRRWREAHPDYFRRWRRRRQRQLRTGSL